MALKHHPTPLSGGDRKALTKEIERTRAMIGRCDADREDKIAA